MNKPFPRVGKRGGEEVRETGVEGGGGTGEGGRGDRKEWEEGKGEGSTNHTFKYLPYFQTFKLPFLPSFLIYHFRQTKFDRYYIMY